MKAYLVVMLAQSEIGECWVPICYRSENRANNVCPLVSFFTMSTKGQLKHRNFHRAPFLRTETRKWFNFYEQKQENGSKNWKKFPQVDFFTGLSIFFEGVGSRVYTQVHRYSTGYHVIHISCIHTWSFTYTCVYIHVPVHTYIMHTYIHTCMYVYMYVHMCGTHSCTAGFSWKPADRIN